MQSIRMPLLLCLLATAAGCSEQQGAQDMRGAVQEAPAEAAPPFDRQSRLTELIPKGYVLHDTAFGDLNKDGLEDAVLVIKGTDTRRFEEVENRGTLDRNRRGLVILFRKEDRYEVAAKNYDCFSSENEDGGVYFPPDLSVETGEGKLFLHYAHGRYGYWRYTFRYQDGAFVLIGYDASENRGPIVERETSINFLTGKKIVKVNTNVSSEGNGDEVFRETVEGVKKAPLLRLEQVSDFDELAIEQE